MSNNCYLTLESTYKNLSHKDGIRHLKWTVLLLELSSLTFTNCYMHNSAPNLEDAHIFREMAICRDNGCPLLTAGKCTSALKTFA